MLRSSTDRLLERTCDDDEESYRWKQAIPEKAGLGRRGPGADESVVAREFGLWLIYQV